MNRELVYYKIICILICNCSYMIPIKDSTSVWKITQKAVIILCMDTGYVVFKTYISWTVLLWCCDFPK
jgi:hypothetical protein